MTQSETPTIGRCAAWEVALKTFCDWIETIVSKEIENLVDGLTREQLLDLRIVTLQKLDAAIQARLSDETSPPTFLEVSKLEQPKLLTYAQAPLAIAIPQYLTTCTGPQTAKQITKAFLEAGRDFETSRPVHAVRTALSKLMGANPDLFHVTWAKWWLKSKCTKSQLEKYMAKNAKFGTGGHTKKEHGKRTAAGIEKRRRSTGNAWGPPIKATPELLERAREMLRNGVTLTEVCQTLDVATWTLYQHGIRQRSLREEGKRRKEAAAADQSPMAPTGDQLRAMGVIPLHAKAAGEE